LNLSILSSNVIKHDIASIQEQNEFIELTQE